MHDPFNPANMKSSTNFLAIGSSCSLCNAPGLLHDILLDIQRNFGTVDEINQIFSKSVQFKRPKLPLYRPKIGRSLKIGGGGGGFPRPMYASDCTVLHLKIRRFFAGNLRNESREVGRQRDYCVKILFRYLLFDEFFEF